MTVHNYKSSPGEPLPFYLPATSFVKGKFEDGAVPIVALGLAILAGMAFVYWDQRHQPNFYKNAAYLVSGMTLAGGGYWVARKILFPKEAHDPFLHQDVFEALEELSKTPHNINNLNRLCGSIAARPGALATLRYLTGASDTSNIFYIDKEGTKRKTTKGALFTLTSPINADPLGQALGSNFRLCQLERRVSIHALRAFGDTYLQQLACRFVEASNKAKKGKFLTQAEKISLEEIVWLKDRLPLDQEGFEDADFHSVSHTTKKAICTLHQELRYYHRCEDWSSGDLALFHGHRSRQVTQAKHRWSCSLTSLLDLSNFILPESWVGHDYHTQVFSRDEEGNPQIGHLAGQWEVCGFGLSQRLRCRHVAVTPPGADETTKQAFFIHINNLSKASHPHAGMSGLTAISCALPRFGRISKNAIDDQVIVLNDENASTTSISGSCTTLPYYIHNTARKNAGIQPPLLQAHTRPSGLYGGRYARELDEKGWVDHDRIDVLEAILDWEPSIIEKVHRIVAIPLGWIGIF